ncbi:hypothetical protein [Lysobacter sp. A3-1-A15]|uniref:hypothetical protein n=1 Tax=Novilysobacter viscosus TaxID=3098602 RepID=UPI002EDB1259
MRDAGLLKAVRLVSLVALVVGALLAVMMVLTESEPGALPLALIVVGAVGYGLSRLRTRGG